MDSGPGSYMCVQFVDASHDYVPLTAEPQLHDEQLPAVQERYADEIKRILGVIDTHLSRTGRQYLVGDKLSFVDLMFVPWDTLRAMVLMTPSFEETVKDQYPQFHVWEQRLQSLDSVKKAHKFALDSAATAPGAEAGIEATLPK
jgi:glutathione S-transferase